MNLIAATRAEGGLVFKGASLRNYFYARPQPPPKRQQCQHFGSDPRFPPKRTDVILERSFWLMAEFGCGWMVEEIGN